MTDKQTLLALADATDDEIDNWLVENCGRGIPFENATDEQTMLHGLAYLLRQLSACPGYKPNVGQIGPATTAVNMALRTFARQAITRARAGAMG